MTEAYLMKKMAEEPGFKYLEQISTCILLSVKDGLMQLEYDLPENIRVREYNSLVRILTDKGYAVRELTKPSRYQFTSILISWENAS